MPRLHRRAKGTRRAGRRRRCSNVDEFLVVDRRAEAIDSFVDRWPAFQTADILQSAVNVRISPEVIAGNVPAGEQSRAPVTLERDDFSSSHHLAVVGPGMIFSKNRHPRL
jgi:hypothetical protein